MAQAEPTADRLPSDDYPLTGKQEQRLLMRALRLGWDIPQKYKAAILNRQIAIAIDPDKSDAKTTAAANVVARLNEQNIRLTAFLEDRELSDAPIPEEAVQTKIDSLSLSDKLKLKQIFDKTVVDGELVQ